MKPPKTRNAYKIISFYKTLTEVKKNKISLTDPVEAGKLFVSCLVHPASTLKEGEDKVLLIQELINRKVAILEQVNGQWIDRHEQPLLDVFMRSLQRSLANNIQLIEAYKKIFTILISTLDTPEKLIGFASVSYMGDHPENEREKIPKLFIADIISAMADAQIQILQKGQKIDSEIDNMPKAIYAIGFFILEKLLERGLPADAVKTHFQDTLFMVAAVWDLKKLMILLKKYGADPSHRNKYGETALHACAKNKLMQYRNFESIKAVEYLLDDLKVTVDTRDLEYNTPFFSSIRNEKFTLAGSLFKHGARVDVINMQGYTPLMLLLQPERNQIEFARMLLINGHVNPNLVLPGRGSALSVVTSNNNKEVVELLLEYGASWDLIINKDGGTAFHVALGQKDPELVKLFFPSILASPPLSELNLLYYSVFFESEEAIFFILSNLEILNININAVVKLKRTEDTSLAIAIQKQMPTVVQQLLAHGADKYLKFGTTKTNAIHWACAHGNLVIVKLLVENEYDANFANDYSLTPLMVAAINNHLEIVEYLVSMKANIDAVNRYSHHALAVTLLFERPLIVPVLLKYARSSLHQKINKLAFLDFELSKKMIARNPASKYVSYTGNMETAEKINIHYLSIAILSKDIKIIKIFFDDPNFSRQLSMEDLHEFLFMALATKNNKLFHILLDFALASKNETFKELALKLHADKRNSQEWQIEYELQGLTIRAVVKEGCINKNVQLYDVSNTAFSLEENKTTTSSIAYLKDMGYSLEEIKAFKKLAKETTAIANALPFFNKNSLNSNNTVAAASWFDGRLSLPCSYLYEVEGGEKNRYFYYIDEAALLEQGCTRKSLEIFKIRRVSFNNDYKDISDSAIKVKVNINGNPIGENIIYTHQLSKKGEECILAFGILSDDKRHVLFILAKYINDGLHDNKDFKSLYAQTKPLNVTLPFNKLSKKEVPQLLPKTKLLDKINQKSTSLTLRGFVE